MESGIPAFQLPWQFNVNQTAASINDEASEGPFEIAGDLGIGIVMVALVSVLQHMAIAKFYCRESYVSFLEKWSTL